jgi:hypothetical protein
VYTFHLLLSSLVYESGHCVIAALCASGWHVTNPPCLGSGILRHSSPCLRRCVLVYSGEGPCPDQCSPIPYGFPVAHMCGSRSSCSVFMLPILPILLLTYLS